MAAEGSGRGERPDDSDDIDARFEEIVAGLRAEQDASTRRRAEAIRRAEIQRRDRERQSRESQNRPLEGHDDPNPWPPTPRPAQGTPNPPAGPGSRTPGETGGGGAGTGGAGGAGGAGTSGTGAGGTGAGGRPTPGRHRPSEPASDYDAPAGGSSADRPHPDQPHPDQPHPSESWRSWEESDEEEHFIPPTPPLPAGDLHLWAIVLGLLGGPIVLILSEVLHVLHSSWWTPLGILMFLAGVTLLVLRLPKNRDYTDTSGGAQV